MDDRPSAQCPRKLRRFYPRWVKLQTAGFLPTVGKNPNGGRPRKPDLSEAERREIELAENLDRKDLTAAERSRQMVALAETAAEVLEVVSKTPLSNGGRPPKRAVSEEAIAERIGVERRTLNNATRHVAAIDAYPELTRYAQSDVLKIAAKLNAMPEGAREETRARILTHDGDLLASLTDRPPMPSGPSPREQAAKDPAG